MPISKHIFIYILFLFESCGGSNKRTITEITTLIKSSNPTDVIEACSNLNSIRDTIFLADVFRNIYDARISHDLRFKGISVYQAKMSALRRISGLQPPHKIDYKIDTININFYLEWAITNRLY